MNIFFSAILLLWSGTVIGLSFIATPAKFLAPHLTMPLALEVGKVTFHTFNKVEWTTLLLTSTVLFFYRASFIKCLPLVVVFIILLLQSFWLLPVMDQRVSMVIAGNTPEGSIHHWVYIFVEAFKAITLMVAGIYIICKGTSHV